MGDDNDFLRRIIRRPSNSADSGLLFYNESQRIYCPPRQRSRIMGPYTLPAISSSNNQRPSIDKLTNECLVEVLKRLPGVPERSSSACVSRRWLAALSTIRHREFSSNELNRSDDNAADDAENNPEVEFDGYLARILPLEKATNTTLAAIAISTSSGGGLRKLSINGCNPLRVVSDIGMTAIARGCPLLRDLLLWSLHHVGDNGLIEIARECRGLRKLFLCDCPYISDEGLTAIAQSCRKLTTITISSCKNIGDDSLHAIAMNCPNLSSLSIADCPLVGDTGINRLMSRASDIVPKTIKLEGLNITDYSVWLIGEFGEAITSLVLSRLRRVNQNGFWRMSRENGLKMLSSLSLTSCQGVTDMSLTALGKVSPNLKHVIVRNCRFVSNDGFVGFARATRSLESFHVEECRGIDLRDILTAVSSSNSQLSSLLFIDCELIKDHPISIELPDLTPCESLRSLSVESCSGFGNSDLAMIGKIFPNLRRLDLSGFDDLTDDDLLPLIECFGSGLTDVNLSFCSNLTDRAVSALSSLHGGSLETLNLDGCLNITDEGLEAVASSCPLLKDLDLSKCSITDHGVAALTRGVLSELEVLSLFGCSMITSSSIPYLVDLRKNMVRMSLEQCSSLSNSIIELFTAKVLRYDVVD